MAKLTQKIAAQLTLPAGKRDAIFFDDSLPGFGLRVRAGGSKRWIYQFLCGSKQRRITLGNMGGMDATRARKRAEELHAQVRLGLDPAGMKQVAQARAHETFEYVMQQYLGRQRERLRPRTYIEVERHLLTNAKSLHGLQLAGVDQRSVATLLAAVSRSSGHVASNRLRATLSSFFGWAIKQGIASANPVAFTEKNAEVSRDRVLTGDELRQVWTALPSSDYGDVLKLLILTGQRKGEIAGMCWGEVDFERDVITLPAQRVKNGRTHRLPMSSAVREILAGRPRLADRDLVFGLGARGFSGWSQSKKQLDKAIAARRKADDAKPMTPWTVHDLRRTCATMMANIGVQPHVVEACLNHASGFRGGIAGVYNRASYTAEMGQALARWAEHVAAIVENRTSNITPIRPAM
jgi:integrase